MTLSEQIKSGFEDLKGIFSKATVGQVNLEQLQAENKQLQSDIEATKAKLTQAESDLATARQTISTVTAAKEKAETDLAAANAKLANPDEQIKQAASVQAAAITASIGVPPVAAAPADPQPKSKSLTGLERAIAAHKESQAPK